ncbi:MAG: hypothetical protein IKG22_11775 [Atopobiaceae bacterium]|nr:hypothetical protein [Atopobiaceae bacterium]
MAHFSTVVWHSFRLRYTADVAECCSHVNSYPLASLGGISPIDNLGALVPPGALAGLGVTRLDPDEVVLRPSLVPHAVEQ